MELFFEKNFFVILFSKYWTMEKVAASQVGWQCLKVFHFSVGQYSDFIFKILNYGKSDWWKYNNWVINSTISTCAQRSPINFEFFYLYFSMNSIAILLFFRSTESHGKTRWIFTPPIFKNFFKKNLQVLRGTKLTTNAYFLI